MRRPTLRSAAIALCLAASPADAAEPRDLPLLLNTIGLWLVATFYLPAAATAPDLVITPGTELIAMRYGPEATISPDEVVAVYDDATRTIHLAEGWTGRTPAELSVLVHEMVHHLQAAADLRFACPAEREVLVYQAQNS